MIYQEIHVEHSRSRGTLVLIEYLLQDRCSLIGRAVSAGFSVHLRFVSHTLKCNLHMWRIKCFVCG